MFDWIKSGFIESDLASWLAVALAVVAVIFALRRPQSYTEIRQVELEFDADGGKVTLTAILTTTSHAGSLVAKAKLKLGNISVPMVWDSKQFDTPMNWSFAAANTFRLVFTGEYTKQAKVPTEALVDIRGKFSDGSKASNRSRLPLVPKAAIES